MTALLIFAAIAGIIGIVGSIVPGIPGPPVSWVGMLLAFLAQDEGNTEITITKLTVMLVLMVVISIMDYVLPSKITKAAGGSKAASRGALAGMIAGIVLTPIGMIVGSILGAFLAEMFFERKNFSDSARSALGTFVGFMLATGLKLIICGIMLYYIIISIFSSISQSSTDMLSSVLL